ncbi:MAG: c-type cytochrome domain-containing protein, partial [Chthoniobacteraceae bacterium]
MRAKAISLQLKAILALAVLAGGSVKAAEPSAAGVDFFEKRIRPVLVERCYECHSAEAKQKGGLVLDTKAGVLKGGDTGPALVAGEPAKSLLIKAVKWTDKDLQMPPKKRLSEEQI